MKARDFQRRRMGVGCDGGVPAHAVAREQRGDGLMFETVLRDHPVEQAERLFHRPGP